MATVIERNGKVSHPNLEDGVAAPAHGIAVGGNVKGGIVMGDNMEIKTETGEDPQDLANLADELDNATFRKTPKDFSEEKLAKILQKLELIRHMSPTTYKDVMERLGYKVEDANNEVVNTGAVASGRGKVAVGKGGIARTGNVGSITQNPDGTWNVEG